jgi:hypothetical protein
VRHFAGQAMAAAAASERERVEWWRVGGGGRWPNRLFYVPARRRRSEIPALVRVP